MKSDEILQHLDDIAATTSKNEKQAMVTKWAADADFLRVLEYAYNPFKIYGIRQIPERSVSEFGGSDVESEFTSVTWDVLNNLISRTLTGNAARQAVQKEINRLTEASADLFVRIIRKDLRAGFSESTINKAKKGTIPEFPYMRCSLPKDVDLSAWPWESGIISQEKADGMFANIDHDHNGNVFIRSRQGSEFPIEKFAALAEEVQARLTRGAQNHGEIVVERDGVICERQDGNGVLNRVLKGGDFAANEVPRYLMWDQIPLSIVVPKGKFQVPYHRRLGDIVKQLRARPGTSIALIPTRMVKSLPDAFAHYRELLGKGKEGTVIKHPQATWADNTSKGQIKLKLEVDVDLKVVSIVPGRVGTKNEGRAGSLTCVTSCGQLQTDVAVKNEAMRDLVDMNPNDWLGRVIVVRANSIMPPSDSNPLHSLFLPRMVEAGYRTDKAEPDSLVRVKDQFESAVAA